MDSAERGLDRPRIEAHIEKIGFIVRASLVAIDHGLNRSRPGYSANACVIVDPTDERRFFTVYHNINLNNGTAAKVIDPLTPTKSEERIFKKLGNDGAISEHGQCDSHRGGLPIGHFSIGSVLSVHGIRHAGDGNFVPTPLIWGIVTGEATDPKDGQSYWQVTMEEKGDPKAGDSGSVVISSFDLHGNELDKPTAVGVLRRLLGNTFLFSPIPTSFVAKSSS